MKKKPHTKPDDELRPKYDPALIRNGVRGKYAARCRISKKSLHRPTRER
jgi:hypothetical protein